MGLADERSSTRWSFSSQDYQSTFTLPSQVSKGAISSQARISTSSKKESHVQLSFYRVLSWFRCCRSCLQCGLKGSQDEKRKKGWEALVPVTGKQSQSPSYAIRALLVVGPFSYYTTIALENSTDNRFYTSR